jgi:cytochrome c biogenesis factor
MGLDIRWPIGLMFSLLGAMLVIYGLATSGNAELYRHSLGINVNFYWGLLLLVFGGAMLGLAWKSSQSKPDETKEGQSGPESR